MEATPGKRLLLGVLVASAAPLPLLPVVVVVEAAEAVAAAALLLLAGDDVDDGDAAAAPAVRSLSFSDSAIGFESVLAAP